MINLTYQRSVFFAMIVFSASSCGKGEKFEIKESAPIYWEDSDDFAQMDAYYLDTTLVIDRDEGEYLELQFQCFRHQGAKISIEQNIIINSKIESIGSGGVRPYIDAVLYKNEGMPAQVYRYDSSGYVPSSFQQRTLDLGKILSLDSSENYRSIQLRFVYGVSIKDAQNADVGTLSRASSVDFELSQANPEVEKFLRACAPVKNWIPQKS